LFGGLNSLIFNTTISAKQNHLACLLVAAGDFAGESGCDPGIPLLFGKINKKVFGLYRK